MYAQVVCWYLTDAHMPGTHTRRSVYIHEMVCN